MSEEELYEACVKMEIPVDKTMGKGKLIDEIFGEKCEGHYIQPTFIYDYPKEMSPLTKKHRENPELTERFELFVNGKEVASHDAWDKPFVANMKDFLHEGENKVAIVEQ